MKKVFLLSLVFLSSLSTFAYDFEVDGIYYYIKSATDKTVVMTYNNYNSGEYSGDINIPEMVNYNGIELKVIGCDWDTFRGCNLTSIHLPKSFTDFDYNYSMGYGTVFYNKDGTILKVYVPDLESWMNLNYNHGNPFCGFDLYVDNSLVENLIIPEGTTIIPYEKFGSCNSIKRVKLANSVREIGVQAFSGCCNLEFVECNNGLEIIAINAFYEDEKLESINIPSTVKVLGDGGGNGGCFYNCSSLSSRIDISEGVALIPSYFLYGCSQLSELSISSTVTQIYWDAFGECSSLKDIYVYNPTPPLCYEVQANTYSIFHGVDKFNCTIHVPQGSLNLYQSAEGWSQFFNIIEIDEQDPQIIKCATPTIAFANGELTFDCETEDVEFVYNISLTGSQANIGNKVILGNMAPTYTVSVYATKDGYENSDVATQNITYHVHKGDANGDGEITIADAVNIVNIILGNNGFGNSRMKK